MRQFKTESKKLLDLMINSIYTNKEIFLRELISNASDAVDKLNFKSLQDPSVKIDQGDLAIRVSFDKDARTITISDNGIGMTAEELERNLGTIAHSGSEEFKTENAEQQGQPDRIDLPRSMGDPKAPLMLAEAVARHIAENQRDETQREQRLNVQRKHEEKQQGITGPQQGGILGGLGFHGGFLLRERVRKGVPMAHCYRHLSICIPLMSGESCHPSGCFTKKSRPLFGWALRSFQQRSLAGTPMS